jgi:hypothetical protein
MNIRLATLLPLALAVPPSGAGAQIFGTSGGPPTVDANGDADPVTIEIRREGRLFWQGQIEAGGHPNGRHIEILAEPAGFDHCFETLGSSATSTRSLDRLALDLQRSPTSEVPDRHSFRFDWRHIVPLDSLRDEPWQACRESRQRMEDVAFEADVPVPPGGQARVAGPMGFTLTMSRPLGVERAAARPARYGNVSQIGARFGIRLSRAGEILWKGEIRQETSADEARMGERHFVPVRIPCQMGAPRPLCVDGTVDRWAVRIRARDDGLLSVELETEQSVPGWRVRVEGGGTGGEPAWFSDAYRGDQTRIGISAVVALPRGASVSIPAADYLLRVDRR